MDFKPEGGLCEVVDKIQETKKKTVDVACTHIALDGRLILAKV